MLMYILNLQGRDVNIQGFSNSLDKRFNQKFYRTPVKILRTQVEKTALESY